MPWEVPITVDGMRYPVRFNTENEPTQDEIDEAVQQITNQAQPASEKPFWRTGDVLSALGDVATNVLPATWAGVRRGWEGIQKEHSPEYMEAMAADEARNRAVLEENAKRQAAGELSTAGENIREIVPSIGFTGASIPSTMAGARTGAFTGGRAATMAGAPEFAPQAALAGGVIGGFAGGFGASYRMMGAQFMDDAMSHFNELSMQKLKRPLNAAERQEIYDDLLPVAQNTALWEAAPEAIGNLATLGAGKVILGIGKPAFQALVKGAKAKILAGVGSQATELATEGITEFGQGNDQAKLEAYKAGLPMESVAPKYQGAQGLWEATKEVAPAVATLGALTAGAGGLAYGANKALSKAPTELSQAQVEALTARSLASAQADMDEAKSSDEGWMAKNNAIAKAAYKLQNAKKAAEYVSKGQFDEAATMFGGKLTAPNTIVQDQLNASMAGVAANADVAPQTAAVDEQAQNEPIIPTPAGSFVPGATETEEIPGIGAINRADIAGIPPAEPPFANEPPSPESLVGDAGEVISAPVESSAYQAAMQAKEQREKTGGVTGQWKPVASDEPPVPTGFVRFYHAGSQANKGERRWLSPDRTWVANFRPGHPVFFVDIPLNDPQLKKAWDDTGTPNSSRFVNFEADAETSSRLSPIPTTEESSLVAPKGGRGIPVIMGSPGYRVTNKNKSDEYQKQGGWKLHLAVNPDNYKAVDEWLSKNHQGQYKLLTGGDVGQSDFTIYVGDKDEADKLAQKIESQIGDLLLSREAGTDRFFGQKVTGRFDVQRTGKTNDVPWVFYGAQGIPLDQSAAESVAGVRNREDWLKIAQPELSRIDQELAKKYGIRYTGTVKPSQTITGSNVQTGTEMPVSGKSTVTSPSEAPFSPQPQATQTNALQKQSTGSVLQREQKEARKTGSERERVEPSLEGQEAAGARQDEEKVTAPNDNQTALNRSRLGGKSPSVSSKEEVQPKGNLENAQGATQKNTPIQKEVITATGNLGGIIHQTPKEKLPEYQIRGIKGRPATDADGIPTGWKLNEFRDAVELVSEDGSKFVVFPIDNQSSYGDKMRALLKAEDWAIDNPIRAQIGASSMEANYGNGRVEDVLPKTVRFVHTTKTIPGKGQKSGYYPGTYAYESESGFLPSMEGNKFVGELPESDIYTLTDADQLKKDAADFGKHSGNGNAEVKYLQSLGFKAMRRPSMGGTEIIVFDTKDANFKTQTSQPITPQGKPTTATVGKVMPGGSAVERDATKPAQMTPEEFAGRVAGDKFVQSIAPGKEDAWWNAKEAQNAPNRFAAGTKMALQEKGKFFVLDLGTNKYKGFSSKREAMLFFKSKEGAAQRAYIETLNQGKSGTFRSIGHKIAIGQALAENQPVSSVAVDAYKIKLPEGYEKTPDGELYVYNPPQTTKSAANQTAASSREDAEPDVATKDEFQQHPYYLYTKELMSSFPLLSEIQVIIVDDAKGAELNRTQKSTQFTNKLWKGSSAIDPVSGKRLLLIPVWSSPSHIAHEVGHAIEKIYFARADEATKQAIISAHNKWAKKWLKRWGESDLSQADQARLWEDWADMFPQSQSAKARVARWSQSREYLTSFSEWFADNVSKWSSTSAKPVSLLEKFFHKVFHQLKKLWDVVKKDFAPDKSIENFINSIAVGQPTLVATEPISKPQVAAETQTPESVRVDSGAAGVVQSETGKGSILPDDETKETPYNEESIGKVEATGYAEKLNSVRKLLRAGLNSAKAQNEALAVLKAMPVGDLQDAFNVLTGDTTKLTNRTQLANNILNEILAQEKSETAPTVAGVFSQAEQEMEQERERQAKLTESRVQAINDTVRSIAGPGNIEWNAVSVNDGKEALERLVNTNQFPGLLGAFVGTTQQFVEANRNNPNKEYQALVQFIQHGVPTKDPVTGKMTPNVAEGYFMDTDGRSILFTDRAGIKPIDRRLAEFHGVPPAVAASMRILTHEGLGHRGWWGLNDQERAKLASLVKAIKTPEDFDRLTKLYPTNANWRNDPDQESLLVQEFVSKIVESLRTLPKDGPVRRLLEYLQHLWQKFFGKPDRTLTLKELRLFVQALQAGAKAPKFELVNGGKIKMSQLRAQGFVTPEMDKAYMDAVEAGDMEKAQRMVDEAAKAQPIRVLESYDLATSEELVASARAGQPDSKNEGMRRPEGLRESMSLVEIPLSLFKKDYLDFIEESTRPERVKRYASLQIQTPIYVRRSNGDTFTISDGGHRLMAALKRGDKTIRAYFPTAQLTSLALSQGGGVYQGLPLSQSIESTESFSIDPVTRDDAGNVIPLSQRFNAATPDIRASRISYANPIDAQLANAAERLRAMREREAAPPVPKALERLFDVNAQPTGTANKLFQLGQEAPVEEVQQEAAIEPQAIRNEIRAAYDRAMVGESSIQVPIQNVFDEAKSVIPSLTERDFGEQLQNLYEDGSAFLVPTDRSADMIAAGEKWGVYDAAGLPASYVGIMPAQESPIIYATPIDRNAIQTQVEESAKAPVNEDSLKGFLLRAIAMHGQPSSVRMARLDPDAPLQVSAQPNGELVIGLGVRQAGEVIRNSRSTQAGFKYLADAVEEEMIHFADLLAMRSKWEAQGKQIDFDHFIRRQSMELTMDLMQTAETLSIADKEALRKVLAANLASYSNNPNWNNDTLENVLQAYAESPMKMNAELVRSLIQAKRSGEITATGYQRIANTIVKWLQDALNWLKQSYNQARGGTFGNVLAQRIQDVEGQLDALGASANIKASRIGDDIISRQKTDLQKQRITGEQVVYQGYPLTNSQGDPIAITRTQQAYKPRAELARQFVKEVADSLDDITQLPNEVINDSYLRAIGAEYMGDFQTLMLAEAENLLRERAKAETIPEEKQRLNQAVEQAAAFFRQGATQGGLDLNTIKQVQKDPRFAGMFALDTVKTQKKEDQAAVVEPNFNGGYAEGMGALNDEASTEAINDLEEELQDRLDQSWLEKAEATLPEKARLLLAKVRGWLADKAKLLQKIALARSALFLKQSKTKQSVAANAAANPFDSMTVAQVEAEIARMEKEVIKLDKKIGDALESIGDELFDSGDVDSKTSGKEKAERMARTPRKETLLKPGKMTALQRLLDKTRDGWSWKQIFTMPKAGQERRRADMLKKVQENEAFNDLNDDEKTQLVELLDQAWIDRKATYLGQKLKADKTVRLPWVTNKGAAKKLESATPELLKAFNDGTFNKDTFNTILAKKYGVKPIDEKAMERAEQLAEELQDPDLPEPVYARKADELLKLIADTQQLNWAKMLNDAWVASVLAGPRTFFDIGFAALNGLQRVMVESTGLALHGDFKTPAQALSRFISILPQGLKEAAYFIKTGDVSILSNSKHQFARFLSKGLKGGGNHSSTSYQLANWDKDKASDATAAQKLQGKILRTIGRFMQMVERILTALDHINSTATKYAYLPLAIAQNKKKYADVRLPNAQEMEQFRNQAKAYLLEGREPANSGEQTALDAWTRHFSDRYYAHAQDIVEGASYAAGVSSGTVDPEGVIGAIYDNILAMASKATSAADELKLKAKALLKDPEVFRSDAYTKYALATLGQLVAYSARNLLGFRFIRFGANKLNDSLSYIPGIGLFRLAEKENDNATKSQMIWNNQAFGILLMMAGIYAIHAMEDEEDPEKRGFDLQGSWDGLSAEQKKQLSDSGKKEYTITFYRNGKPITLAYKTWPISAMLSAIGTMTDMVKFKREKWDQKQFADRLVAATAIAATSTLDSAALSQFADLVGKSAYQADPDEAFVKRITRVGTNFAGGFVPRVFKDLDYWLLDDKARKYETVWENLGKEVPIYRQHIGGEKLNIFAEPIRTSRSPWSRAVIESPSDEAYRKLGLLNARDIWLTPASPEMRTIGTKNRRRHLTPEEQNRYIKLVGAGYKKIIEQYGDRAISMPKERAKAFIADKTRDVRDRAEKLATRPQ